MVFIKKLPLSISCVRLKTAQLDNPVLAERKKEEREGESNEDIEGLRAA